jgi:PHD/YefM family antitoxin component YafN of YafNO toxin-antitoxin module
MEVELNRSEVKAMEFVPIRDLCASPRKITTQLKRDGRVVITNNGRPTAIMIDVDAANFEETLADLKRLRAKRAMRELQTASVKSGLSKMTMAEIDEEIQAARTERIARETMREA